MVPNIKEKIEMIHIPQMSIVIQVKFKNINPEG
jgi:hypothetical protein